MAESGNDGSWDEGWRLLIGDKEFFPIDRDHLYEIASHEFDDVRGKNAPPIATIVEYRDEIVRAGFWDCSLWIALTRGGAGLNEFFVVPDDDPTEPGYMSPRTNWCPGD